MYVEGRRSTPVRTAIYVFGSVFGAVAFVVGVVLPRWLLAVFALTPVAAADRDGKSVLLLLGLALSIAAAGTGVLLWLLFRSIVLPRYRARLPWSAVSISVATPPQVAVLLTAGTTRISGVLHGMPAAALEPFLAAVPASSRVAFLEPTTPQVTPARVFLLRLTGIAAVGFIAWTSLGKTSSIATPVGLARSAATPAEAFLSAFGTTDKPFDRCVRILHARKLDEVRRQLRAEYSSEDVEDALQTSLLRVCQRVDKIAPDGLEGYFFVSARRAARKLRGRSDRFDFCDFESQPAACTPQDSVEEAESNRLVEIHIEATCGGDPVKRAVLRLRLFDDLPFKEIDAELRLPPGKAGEIFSNTMKRTKKRLEAMCSD